MTEAKRASAAKDYFPTRELARWAVGLKISDLPPELFEETTKLLLDWAGATLAGSAEPSAKMAAAVIDTLDHKGFATVFRKGFDRTDPLSAAFLNGFNSHILEIDDVHKASIYHPGAVIFPTVLAVGEKLGISGKDLLLAAIIGYEVSIRIAETAGGNHYAKWHTTGTCGTFGAAVAAGKILGLDEDQMTWALGNAGTQAAGLWQFLADGALTKPLHPAKAAYNGTLAALLAQRGFSGPERILEGEKGFLAATAVDYDLRKLTADLGVKYRISEVTIKPYPSCRHSHPQIDVALEIAGKPGFDVKLVDRINIKTYQTALNVAGGQGVYPGNAPRAKFDSAYCVSVALLHKRVGLRDFDQTVIDNDREIKRLYGLVNLQKDAEFDRKFPRRWSAAMEVSQRDGQKFTAVTEFAKGDPENPLSMREMKDKALGLAELALAPALAQQLIDRLLNVAALPNIGEIWEGPRF